ncbi:sulfatase family protein [Pontiella sulfatireligans]|uniref:Choline-sulfatase n=1 Tax=Pontiella sulfatireligans TaxID=2750658 RepID=A0A6C2ULK4_9BACT|nr:sulfatase [Pontiella sulfatireligans]SPS74453.1 sulfatase S1_8 [Kiritimatiellales bacterium]VGO20849.1 Choline-sulfatase [Pontiella sulfatireligans]
MLKVLLAGAALATLSIAPVLAEEKPNFVVVLADDVSWSSFGCVDSGLYTRTPNIDKLATQGVRFTNFSCSGAMCCPTRHELYTGLLPPSSGVYANGNGPAGDYKNMVNYLGNLGYNVGLTGKIHFTSKSPFPKVSGFTEGANEKAPTWELSGVKQFIETSQAEDKPFCMVIASVHAHHPWTIGDVSNFPLDKIVVPPNMVDGPITRECLAKHAAEVEELDNQVGATMKLLDEMKLKDNTVLIFLSEQGTAMPNGKYSIYDYGTKALCLVRWPGKIKPAVTDAVAMYCDIAPTLVDMAGGEVPDVDGSSLFPVLKGETSDHREHAYLVHQYGGYTQRAIRNKEYKLIWSPKQENDYYLDVMMGSRHGKLFAQSWIEWLGKAKTDPDAQAKIDRVVKHPEFELYNIKNDPWELDNLASNPEYSQKVEEMHAQLKADMETLNDSFSTEDPKQAKKAKKESAEEKGVADKKTARKKKKNNK